MEPYIKERLESLTPEYQDFVTSDYVSITTDIFTADLNLNKDESNAFSNALTLYILCFLSKADFVDFIISGCGIERSEAERVVNIIITKMPRNLARTIEATYRFFNPTLDEDEITDQTLQKEDIQDSVPLDHSDLSKEIAETEAALKEIQAVRTMQSDYTAHKNNPEK